MANYACDPFPHVPPGMAALPPWTAENSTWIRGSRWRFPTHLR
jgi:hypothetical protein